VCPVHIEVIGIDRLRREETVNSRGAVKSELGGKPTAPGSSKLHKPAPVYSCLKSLWKYARRIRVIFLHDAC